MAVHAVKGGVVRGVAKRTIALRLQTRTSSTQQQHLLFCFSREQSDSPCGLLQGFVIPMATPSTYSPPFRDTADSERIGG